MNNDEIVENIMTNHNLLQVLLIMNDIPLETEDTEVNFKELLEKTKEKYPNATKVEVPKVHFPILYPILSIGYESFGLTFIDKLIKNYPELVAQLLILFMDICSDEKIEKED